MFTSIQKSLLFSAALGVFAACQPTVEPSADPGNFALGIEAATGTDVLLTVGELTGQEISPVGQGVEQPGWMSFQAMGDIIIAHGEAGDNQTTAYSITDGQLVTGGTLITELGLYSACNVDDNTMLAMGLPRAGYENRVIFVIDKTNMSITQRVETKIDERQEEGLVVWPTDMHVRDGQLFVSYYLVGSGELEAVPAFATPNSNQARVAVFSYPGLELEKIITDDRTSDVGVYLSTTALEEDESGDIYTFSTSSNASGFFPTPTNPSGFLRIPSGSTEFDDGYFFNFEEASGGYKINNAVYAGNGKMIVRMVMDDAATWGTYDPVTEAPTCAIAVADLEAQTVTHITDVPTHGGEWGMA
ncbi:MAG TPA: hypothetical protein DCE41_01145, partial [Cytophagales bacterium]|nr:hypothetical protein [Cytophagales bacterium]